jgi:hypothetical protein
VLERRAVEERPDEGLVDALENCPDLGVPTLVGGERISDLAPIRPRLARPGVLLDPGDEVQESLFLDVVVDEVLPWPAPEL